MAHAKSGSLVMDPFLGTGGLLIAASHFGALTLGSDIDPRILRGKHGKNIFTNFEQYQLHERLPDVLISDITKSPLQRKCLFDAIITDRKFKKKEKISS
jgi:tRNA (guanine10-N2)-methyltransferase